MNDQPLMLTEADCIKLSTAEIDLLIQQFLS